MRTYSSKHNENAKALKKASKEFRKLRTNKNYGFRATYNQDVNDDVICEGNHHRYEDELWT